MSAVCDSMVRDVCRERGLSYPATDGFVPTRMLAGCLGAGLALVLATSCSIAPVMDVPTLPAGSVGEDDAYTFSVDDGYDGHIDAGKDSYSPSPFQRIAAAGEAQPDGFTAGSELPAQDEQTMWDRLGFLALSYEYAATSRGEHPVEGELITTVGANPALDQALLALACNSTPFAAGLEGTSINAADPFGLGVSGPGPYFLSTQAVQAILHAYFGAMPNDLSYLSGSLVSWAGDAWQVPASDTTSTGHLYVANSRLDSDGTASFDCAIIHEGVASMTIPLYYHVTAVRDDACAFGYRLTSMVPISGTSSLFPLVLNDMRAGVQRVLAAQSDSFIPFAYDEGVADLSFEGILGTWIVATGDPDVNLGSVYTFYWDGTCVIDDTFYGPVDGTWGAADDGVSYWISCPEGADVTLMASGADLYLHLTSGSRYMDVRLDRVYGEEAPQVDSVPGVDLAPEGDASTGDAGVVGPSETPGSSDPSAPGADPDSPSQDDQATWDRLAFLALSYGYAADSRCVTPVNAPTMPAPGENPVVDANILRNTYNPSPFFGFMDSATTLDRYNPLGAEQTTWDTQLVSTETIQTILATYYGSAPSDLSYLEANGAISWVGDAWQIIRADGPFAATIYLANQRLDGDSASFDCAVQYWLGILMPSTTFYHVTAVRDDASLLGYHLTSMVPISGTQEEFPQALETLMGYIDESLEGSGRNPDYMQGAVSPEEGVSVTADQAIGTWVTIDGDFNPPTIFTLNADGTFTSVTSSGETVEAGTWDVETNPTQIELHPEAGGYMMSLSAGDGAYLVRGHFGLIAGFQSEVVKVYPAPSSVPSFLLTTTPDEQRALLAANTNAGDDAATNAGW